METTVPQGQEANQEQKVNQELGVPVEALHVPCRCKLQYSL